MSAQLHTHSQNQQTPNGGFQTGLQDHQGSTENVNHKKSEGRKCKVQFIYIHIHTYILY